MIIEKLASLRETMASRADYEAAIERAATAAANLSRADYERESHGLAYDLARDAARDRGYTLSINIEVDTRPLTPHAAILKMADDERAARGEPRIYAKHYRPRVYVDWGDCEPCDFAELLGNGQAELESFG